MQDSQDTSLDVKTHLPVEWHSIRHREGEAQLIQLTAPTHTGQPEPTMETPQVHAQTSKRRHSSQLTARAFKQTQAPRAKSGNYARSPALKSWSDGPLRQSEGCP